VLAQVGFNAEFARVPSSGNHARSNPVNSKSSGTLSCFRSSLTPGNEVPAVGRQEVAQLNLSTPEFRKDRFEGHYYSQLHRASNPDNLDPTGPISSVNSGLDVGDICVGFEASSEFFLNGQVAPRKR
jgi:hypothetical protein